MAKYDHLKRYQKEKEAAQHHAQTYDEILKGLKEDPRLQEEFAGYEPESVEAFYRDYASYKANLLKYGPGLLENQDKEELKWVEAAFEAFEQIQQKKLFDLQCLWRAEQVELPGILISYDFMYWENNIMNCPFLEPVTGEEVDMFARYMQDFNYDPDPEISGKDWQNYPELKQAYHDDRTSAINFPDWYDFHNTCTGNSLYLSLPDVRGQKEQRYLDLYIAEKREKKASPAPVKERMPGIHIYKAGFLDWFVLTFENEETQACKERYLEFDDQEQTRHDTALDFAEDLKRHGGIWPMKTNSNWLDGLEQCVQAYAIKKTTDALPVAFEQYQMLLNLGVPYEFESEEIHKFLQNDMRSRVLRGRVLAGEPEDFDF